MLNKTLIAAIAALTLAGASLPATTTPAAATFYGYGYGYGGGNGWHFGYDYRPQPRAYHYRPSAQKYCQPTYKKIKVWRPNFGWVWQTVYAGQSCSWRPVYRGW